LVVVLAGFVISEMFSERVSNSHQSETKILQHIDTSKIAKIVIESSDLKVELEKNDARWVVPEKASYPANIGAVRTFLLKLLDLGASQKIPTTTDNLEKLGVNDDAYHKGYAKVSLKDENNQVLAALNIGETRKTSSGRSSFTVGQYVRLSGDDTVYLTAQPVALVRNSAQWLNTEISNIPVSNVLSVKVARFERGALKTEFELTQSDNAIFGNGPEEFAILPKPMTNKQLDIAIVRQITSGLENLQLSDISVENVGKEIAKITYSLTTGLVYSIVLSEVEGRSFIKLAVTFDDALVQNVKEKYSKMIEESDGKNLREPLYSSNEEANRLNAEYLKWHYEIPTFTSERFRKGYNDVVK